MIVYTVLFSSYTGMTINTFFYFSDDVMCSVRSFFIYNSILIQKLTHQKLDQKIMFGMMYLHLAIASLGTMVPDICEKAGIHILDEVEFACRHNMSITEHKSESSLKTYTGYAYDRALRDMSNTISSNLCYRKQRK